MLNKAWKICLLISKFCTSHHCCSKTLRTYYGLLVSFSIKTGQSYVKNTLYDKSFLVHRNFSCKLINEKKSYLPMSPAVIALFFTLAGIWYLGCKKYLNAEEIETVKKLIRNINEGDNCSL